MHKGAYMEIRSLSSAATASVGFHTLPQNLKSFYRDLNPVVMYAVRMVSTTASSHEVTPWKELLV